MTDQILITIKDRNKQNFLLELLKEFDFVEIELKSAQDSVDTQKTTPLTPEQQDFVDGLKQALKDVQLHQQGKLKLKSYDEFIKEL